MPSPVVLAAHGTRSAKGRALVEELAVEVVALLPGRDVRVGCVDTAVQRPGVDEVLHALAPSPDEPALVVPVLLSRGKHVRADLAEQVAAAGVPARTAGPLGPAALLAAAGARRLAEAGVEVDVPVVLVAAGSKDPAAQVDLAEAARLLAEARGPAADGDVAATAHAFVTAAPPRPALTLRRLAEETGRTPAVSPYVLAPGALPERMRVQGRGHVVADVLGGAPEVALRVVEVALALEQGAADLGAPTDARHH